MDRAKRAVAYEAYMDQLPIQKSIEKVTGATIGDSFAQPSSALQEIDTVRQMYELMSALPVNRRSRVFRYLSEVMSDED